MKMKNDRPRKITGIGISKNTETLIYRPDDSLELKVLFEEETVWLSQKQIAELFQTTRPNVTAHVKNILDEEGLSEDSVSKDYLHTASDGKSYRTRYYCLDVIVSVGHRVRSNRGIRFLQWANEVMSEDHETCLDTSKNAEMIIYKPDNSLKLKVLLENETVWLSQTQMAELFQTTRSNVTRHIKNIFDEEELDEKSNVSFFHIANSDKPLKLYNLDVIISVGYRVRSKRGTQFRQWATGVLRDYLLKGHAVNQRFERIEHRVSETEKKIEFFVRTSLPPVQGVFFEGQIFDAHAFVSDLVRSAKISVVLIDNYIDDSILLLLSKRPPKVTADVYTKQISAQLQMDLKKHNTQYEPVRTYETDRFHDRFLIIDRVVYHVGSSFKDLGRKLFAFSRMNIRDEEILKGL